MNIAPKTQKLVLTALMTCMILVATMLFKVPVPFTQGNVNLGDGVIFLSVLLLGVKHGAIAAALGSSMGDILGGYAMWAPWTFAVKGVMALVMGTTILYAPKKTAGTRAFGMLLAGLWMTAGYYVAGGAMYGNWLVALAGVPWDIGQFTAGAALATALTASLGKSPARKHFVLLNQ
jgi:uncharacterized membrane protein